MKTKKTVRNCDRQFKFVCPQLWSDLKETDERDRRFCDKCEQVVYLCVSDDETLEHARAGHCVAREIPDESELPWMVLGKPEEPVEHIESQLKALEWERREDGINDSL